MTREADQLKNEILGHSRQMPVHVAIIMDGNGRWAAIRNKPRTFGHEAGVKAVKEVVKAAVEIGIKYLTLYTFSIENWKRPRAEVAALMSLLSRTTRREIDELIKNDVKLITTGRMKKPVMNDLQEPFIPMDGPLATFTLALLSKYSKTGVNGRIFCLVRILKPLQVAGCMMPGILTLPVTPTKISTKSLSER